MVLGLRGSAGAPTKDQLKDRRRFRKLNDTVELGDRLWRLLGAWPWAGFPDEITDRWWEHETPQMPSGCSASTGYDGLGQLM